MRNRALLPALLILAAVVVLSIAFTRLRQPRGPVIFAELQAAPGLREGAPVSFRGVAVGGVTQIGFVPRGARLTIAIARPDVPLRRGDGVRLRPIGVLGEIGAEIVPASQPSLPIASGAVLGEARPDSAMLREEAFRQALLRRVAPEPARDSAAPPTAGAGKKP